MTTDNGSQQPDRRRRLWIALGTPLLIVLVLYLALNKTPVADDAAAQPTFAVAEGPLTISVVEAGTIRPREQIILKNEVEGQTVILFLIAEGTQVKSGDLLVELDASELLDQRVNQQIQVTNAEAAFVNARENLAVVKSQAQADIDQAALDLQFARQDLEQYQVGEFPKLEKEAQATIALAEETLTNANNTYDWSKKLFAEKYIAEAELKKDELSRQKAQIDLELARDQLDLLQNFTYKRKMTELESGFKQAEMALERTRRKAVADVVQAEAKMKASRAEYRQQQDKFAKLETQIGKTKIYAPMDGTVIYATSTKMNWRGNSEPLDEGQTVRERQELIYLPTTASYDAEIKVHESSLEKIRSGLPVQITIDALPGRTFSGRVTSIAPLPDATSMFLNPDLKVYNTIIQVDGNDTELRNGMSCQAEIISKRFDKTRYVPLQAVIRVAAQPTVYVAREDGFEPRPVQVGLDNNRMIQILDGLDPGEQVLLTPPLAAAAAPADAAGQAQATAPEAGQKPPATDATNVPPKNGHPTAKGAAAPEQAEQMRHQPERMKPAERNNLRAKRQATVDAMGMTGGD